METLKANKFLFCTSCKNLKKRRGFINWFFRLTLNSRGWYCKKMKILNIYKDFSIPIWCYQCIQEPIREVNNG
jgi:hypothetical protein